MKYIKPFEACHSYFDNKPQNDQIAERRPINI